MEVGDRAVISGSVSPRRSGITVVLQRKSGRSWDRVASKETGTDGAFKFRFRTNKAGRSYYRVSAPAASRFSAGVSDKIRVDVYRWRYISQMDWHEDGDWEGGAVTINGSRYAESIYADNIFWGDLEVNTDGKCTKLAGVAGLTNESDSGAVGGLSVLRDGSEIYYAELSMASANSLNLDVSGALRLAFHNTDLADGDSRWPEVGIGNAKAYCRS